MRQSLFDYCVQHHKELLLSEWDTEKNDGISPQDIGCKSTKKVWWKCSAKEHSWQSVVYSRTTSGSGCPYCSGHKTSPDTSLLAVAPQVAAQWHPTKNGTLTPDQVPPASTKYVWWVCEKGHEWQAVVHSRSRRGLGCPICSNRRLVPGINDLATTHPQLVSQWHPEKNLPLTPQQVVHGSERKVWWLCEKGHTWTAPIKDRANGLRGCPVCANMVIVPGVNDLVSQFPAIAAQWLQNKNDPLRPDQVSPGSNKRVWWECEKGHHWKAAVAERTFRGRGCPYCVSRYLLTGFNDLATLRPEVAKDWHPTLNGDLTPEQVTARSNKSVWWHCEEGHVWKAYICNRTAKQPTGCPICAGNISAAKRKYYEQIAEQLAVETILSSKHMARKTEVIDSTLAPKDMKSKEESTS